MAFVVNTLNPLIILRIRSVWAPAPGPIFYSLLGGSQLTLCSKCYCLIEIYKKFLMQEHDS